MIRTQLLAKLVSKYPGLSKSFLGQLADKLSATVTEETEIEGKISELDNLPISIKDLAAEFQKEGDRRVTDAKKEWDKKNTKPPAKEDTEDTEDEQDEEEPAPPPKKRKDSATIALLKELAAEVKSLKTDKIQTTLRQRLSEKLKDVPEKFYVKRGLPEKEEDLDGFADEILNDYSEFRQEMTDKGFASLPVPGGGSRSNGGPSKPTEKELDEVLDKIKI